MMSFLPDPTLIAAVDWPSLGWTALLGVLTAACLTVRVRFRQIAAAGRAAEILAHVVVGYFGVGMALFGGAAALHARFPVPGGVAWEGPIAVIGGIAALVIGSTTLYEHLVEVLAVRRGAPAGPRLVPSTLARGGEQ
jgi:hypothetical protein